ncbi:AbrB/MazE/SpoVT family DNA-binding domain-containing protein [Methanofollis tationis]|uniref:AbrB/MazE/SpoVT family DNA-binding domain-containing protein n=1 Tax=Methanofollis tationis TaxID=81417 RepID=A0A7K4HL95_9EURY|nr:AbrB/MazE/SpoVT family DNA-binding domain-containing protein [Methanofollis tationis]NVO65969.1 AbrB/MazE/SpoVT family DNA-binding domain-containing protein [Methanofollis tationis]
MDIGITRLSSKGQIVIPASMRKDLVEGTHLLVIREGGRFIVKPLDELEPELKEDIIFAERTEKAFEEFKKGTFTRKSDVDFIDDLESW